MKYKCLKCENQVVFVNIKYQEGWWYLLRVLDLKNTSIFTLGVRIAG